MSLAQAAIGLSFCLYLVVAISNARDRDWPMVLVWTSYAASQAGFWWYEMNKVNIGDQ